MKCWRNYKKVGTHTGRSGHTVNTCVRKTAKKSSTRSK